jgi:phosphopantetheine adenylyltransferase
MNIEKIIDKTNLRKNERYTFYDIYGTIIRGTFTNYLVWEEMQNGGLNIDTLNNNQGLISIPIYFIEKITQNAIGPNSDTAKLINSFY